MPIVIELRDADDRPVRGLPDPSGGTFDAAGDFDRLIDTSYLEHHHLDLPTVTTVDPYADTEMGTERMDGLIADISQLLSMAKDGPELRGLLRLQVMAETCSADPELKLIWIGD